MHKDSIKKDVIELFGASENNLKNIDVTIKHDTFTVLTGVSGSGKSTLAFDTIYAEGGRRYIETFSPYTRQFLDRLHAPALLAAHGLRPALALEQKNRITSSRSTVGTISEVDDYLKIIWAELSRPHCPDCKKPIRRFSPRESAAAMLSELTNESDNEYERLLVGFPITVPTAASGKSFIEMLQTQGFFRFFHPDTEKIYAIEEFSSEIKSLSGNTLFVILERYSKSSISSSTIEELTLTIQQCYQFSSGQAIGVLQQNSKILVKFYTNYYQCEDCKKTLTQPTPSLFTYNSPLGACPTCQGFGNVLETNRQACVSNEGLSINEGAINCWSTPSTKRELKKLKDFCLAEKIPLDLAYNQLAPSQKIMLFEGGKKKSAYKGILHWFERLKEKRHKMHVRVFLSFYRHEVKCPSCNGGRLRQEAFLYRIQELCISDIWKIPLTDVSNFISNIEMTPTEKELLKVPHQELLTRIDYLNTIGLGYLTLGRPSRTLSGGEAQRVNLTSILGSGLSNTTIVLDEPTVGLHSRDTKKLLSTIRSLRDKGNTMIVVEHDPEIITGADEVIDIGPGAGKNGGNIVFQGAPEKLKLASSLTGKSLNEPINFSNNNSSINLNSQSSIAISNASKNNLKNISVSIPLNHLVAVSGVSGSGKSTLIKNCLFDTYQNIKNHRQTDADLTGYEQLNDIILVDQSPLGKTPRANPATYTKVWEIIRNFLAANPAAINLGLTKSHFSFNVDGGRCPVCSGAGKLRVEMQFLADVFVVCDACGGTRFQEQILNIFAGGKNVLDFLSMTISEAYEFFLEIENYGELIRPLIKPLVDLDLGYLTLGQPLSEISGGEAQRIKLSAHLKSGAALKKNMCGNLFILDEPTTGLHPQNIKSLIKALRALINVGHSVICIEHNLLLLAEADWIIDLGPEGGDAGGEIIAEGTPLELANSISTKSETAKALKQLKDSSNKTPSDQYPATARSNYIEIVNAREHNLKNISAAIPEKQITVMTGVSGSGKSSLAFDVLFAEGQRRYIDSLSPYARQYIKQLKRADVDRIVRLPPTVAISQKTAPPSGISTVGTVTEVYHFLRLLFAKTGILHCPKDNSPIGQFSASGIRDELIKRFSGKRLFIFAPVVTGRKGHYRELFERALKAEIFHARVDGSMTTIQENTRLDRNKLHWVSLLVSSISKPSENADLLLVAIEQALVLGSGTIEVAIGTVHEEPMLFGTSRVCPTCLRGYRELDPQDFSFRSTRGMCKRCEGRGQIELKNKLSTCPECKGSRIAEIGRHVFINNQTIYNLSSLKAPELLNALSTLAIPERLSNVSRPILQEITARLKLINSVGLDYLSLDRDANTISGGEAQRLRLSKTLGSPLTGVCYILDEPTIGLHSQDQQMLTGIFRSLADNGNTVVIVEHDEEIIRSADHIIDLGPGGGREGGEIVACGSLNEIINNPISLTAKELREKKTISVNASITKSKPSIVLSNCTANNLKNVTATFPLHSLTVVCGISGSGKSSLIHQTLVPALTESLTEEPSPNKTYGMISGTEIISRLVEIDQTPIGKTSTSTPASYLGIFDEIRKIYAMLPDSKARGWTASHFSYNSGKGRCTNCQGRGYLTIPMSFLPEATAECDLCRGLRYTEETMQVRFQGLSIGELLKYTFTDAANLFKAYPKVNRVLSYVLDLGLGYISLGQPTPSISGGEAQRLKIAKELGSRDATDTLYILDEPTVGLHMSDVRKLIAVLNKLVAQNNTVVVIEHNLDVICAASHLIELGAKPGEAGGKIVFEGTPAELIKMKLPTATSLALSNRGCLL